MIGALNRSLIGAAILVAVTVAPTLGQSLADRIDRIMERPEFRHAHFGVSVYSVDGGRMIYELNGEKLFTPASTTKLLTSGALLHLLGPDYRFRTPIYRTGPIIEGVLDGDLLVVASGDPNLSNRIQSDGTLSFNDNDHAYGGPPVSGDPLVVIRRLADQIAAAGIRRVLGRVLVDATLFEEGDRELGSGIVLSPMAVNDNIIDLTVYPGAELGAPVRVGRAPLTAYLQLVNHATTGARDTETSLQFTSDDVMPDGSRRVVLSGTVPLGADSTPLPYAVPVPSRFAEFVLTEALEADGVTLEHHSPVDVDFDVLSAYHRQSYRVVEHVSPPLTEEVKVILKVSQNMHASAAPLYLPALLGNTDGDRTGFDEIHDFLESAGLDLGGARQADGAGGDAHFSPNFMVSYLRYVAERPYFDAFRNALPILGRDGTLADILPDSPAAGRVYAKTGTFVVPDPLNRAWLLTAKGLAGYIDARSGQRLVFAAYVNNVPLADLDLITPVVGQALGEIAAAVYEAN
jgi:D-alanyl-D-alanine carboxypeptidase/D-alanyl-D-alanine-endopeptidase (penicillin-binding protein 4)